MDSQQYPMVYYPQQVYQPQWVWGLVGAVIAFYVIIVIVSEVWRSIAGAIT